MIALEWIWSSWQTILTIVAALFLLRYRKTIYKDFIFTPLAGGNGKIQMDEGAKGVLVLVFIFCVYKEAYRTTEYHIFSNEFFFALLTAICAIAGLKQYFKDKNGANKP